MAGTPQKKQVIDEMRGKLESAKGAVLVEYVGLNVATAIQLRRKFLEHGVHYQVIKNTLTAIAARDLGLGEFADHLTGPNAIAISESDAVAPAKALKEFINETKSEAITVKAGLLEGAVIGVDEVQHLADLPSREVLLAKVVGSMQAPITGFVRCLQGNITNLVYVLEAIRKQKESA
ncbi:50S ribosomal protein L10 [Negativicoccus succinicivorans]|uniref:50S ribosomal protein L10 n=1 Tax=Negativicoccus succinicivorans TaxID=620903 RepID=UPI0029050E86|nr:50S ribosomal protein L10 [Negativicoccus succinicivorans]MDU2929374.1 50S ribosomal protein L10 [Negativicoccus succinicivorans]